MSRIEILIVGDHHAALQLACDATGASCTTVQSVGEALQQLRQHSFDLVVFALPRRGLFSQDDVNRMQQAAPLSRLIIVAGPWCEGPWRRREDVVSGATILPWHRFDSWLATNAAQLQRKLPAVWSLPATSAVDELAEFASRSPLPRAAGMVLIESPDRDRAQAISDVLSLTGYASVWQQSGENAVTQGATVLVVDAQGWNDQLGRQIAANAESSPQTPIFLALNFPLPADVEQARAAGAHGVIAKPFTLAEFLGQLTEVVSRRNVVVVDAA